MTPQSSDYVRHERSFSVETSGQENDTITLRASAYLCKGHKLKCFLYPLRRSSCEAEKRAEYQLLTSTDLVHVGFRCNSGACS